MPQTFQVLRCYKCAVFQIHPSKKSNKFQCKMCGEKQSIKRHYGIGTGKDCRLHVQRLNSLRDVMTNKMEQNNSLHDTSEEDEAQPCKDNTKPLHSKWSEYVEEENIETHNENEPMYLGNTEVVLEVPRKRARKSKIGANYNDSFERKCLDKNINYLDNNQGDTDTKSGNVKDIISEVNSMANHKNNKSQVKFVPPLAKLKTENDTKSGVKVKYCYKSVEDNQTNQKNEEKKITRRDFVKSNISTNSKWSQFVEDENINQIDENEENLDQFDQIFDVDKDESANDPKSLFSLCNDADLDNVLDI